MPRPLLRQQRRAQPRKLQPQALLALLRLESQHPVLHQVWHPAFLAQETTLSPRHRAWVFLAQFHVRVTIRSHHHRAWAVQVRAVRQALVVLLVLAALVAQVAQLVPAVPVAQAVQAVPVVRRAQGSLDHAQVSAAEQQQVEPQVSAVVLAHHVRVEVQVQAVAAVSVVEPPVPSVKVALAVHPRLASRSARNAKSTNREQHRA
jgi:hypothetical protein